MNPIFGLGKEGKFFTMTAPIDNIELKFSGKGVELANVRLNAHNTYEDTAGETKENECFPTFGFYGKTAKVFHEGKFKEGEIVEIGFTIKTYTPTGKTGVYYVNLGGIYVKHAKGSDGKRLDGGVSEVKKEQASSNPDDVIPF